MTDEVEDHDRDHEQGHDRDIVLEVSGLKVHFPIRAGALIRRQVGAVKAVDGVDLTVTRGRTLGLVGESGCGKSTLGKALLKLVEPTEGTIVFDGEDISDTRGEELRRLRSRMQMVFQDPLSSLNPRQSVETLLTEPLRAHGIRFDPKTKVAELLAQVGLPSSAASRYPHEFSGGQRQRIGIARAVALEPDLVIADEPVSALDVSIQAQVLSLLRELQKDLGLTYVVIAHDLAVVRHVSDDIAVMYLGVIVEETTSEQLYDNPMHPYTKALMSAVPLPDPVAEDARTPVLLSGELPSPANPPDGCRFHPRCPFRQPTRCADERPELVEYEPGQRVACHWAREIASGEITAEDAEITAEEPEP